MSESAVESNPGVRKLGDRIRTICNQHGGVTKTAELLNIHKGRVQAWCTSKNEPPALFLRRLAHMGGVSVDWLLSDPHDGVQEMAWVEMRRGVDAMLRAGAIYAAAEASYHRPRGDRS